MVPFGQGNDTLHRSKDGKSYSCGVLRLEVGKPHLLQTEALVWGCSSNNHVKRIIPAGTTITLVNKGCGYTPARWEVETSNDVDSDRDVFWEWAKPSLAA